VIGPNPQSPIPNPQSPIPIRINNKKIFEIKIIKIIQIIKFKLNKIINIINKFIISIKRTSKMDIL